MSGDPWDPKDHRVLQERLAVRASKDSLDRGDPKVAPELKDIRDPRVMLVKWESPDSLEMTETRDTLVLRGNLDRREIGAKLDLPDHRVTQGLSVQRVILENVAHRGQRVKRDLQVFPARKEMKASVEILLLTDQQVFPGLKEKRDQRVTLVYVDHPVLPVLQDQRESVVCRACLVIPEALDPRDHLVRRVVEAEMVTRE